MSEPEEPGVEAALAVLGASTAELEARLAASDDSEAAVRRPSLEGLAAMAWALPATPVTPAMRDRLLARLQGDETQLVAPMLRLGPPPEAPALRLPEPASTGARPSSPALRPVPSRRPEAAPAAARRSWALPLAAVLALCTLGLAGWSFVLRRDLAATRDELAKARRRSTELVAQLDAAQQRGTERASLEGHMRDMHQQLALVTAAKTLVCPLRPSPGAPAAAGATGVLFVADDHQHWYLRAQKLQQLPEDRVYQLWFLVGNEPVRAGAFALSGEEGVLTSPTMPHGTSAAMVTIEPRGAPGDRPSGPVVLYGRDMAPLT